MEKFKKVPDDLEWSSLNRHEINLNGRQFEVFAHQVMYGFRIRGGWVGEQTCEFDWCCGANKMVIISSQRVLMNLIERGTALHEIPKNSNIKPWFNDPEFIQRVDELFGEEILLTIAKLFQNEKMGA